MLSGFFKPKWQHANARIRIQALATLGADSPELIQLAQNDPNTGVRLEAIAYLTDMPTLVQMGKRTDSIGERARHRVIDLVSSDGDIKQDEMLIEVFDWFRANSALVQSIARDKTRSAGLRKLAVAEISDEGLLLKIASEDASKEIQYLAASQINDSDKLKQLEKTQGRNNKRLRQLLKERMATEQADNERVATLEALCAELDALGLSGQWGKDKTHFRVVTQSWKQQSELAAIPEALVKRFHNAEREYSGRLENHERQLAAMAPMREVFEQCFSDADSLKQTLHEQPEQLTSQAVDQQLEQLQERWASAEKLPDAEQEVLNQRWVKLFVSLTEKRDELADELNAIGALKTACKRVESMKQSKKPLQGKRLTALQAEWIKIKRPHQMSEAVTALESQFHQAMDSLNARLLREAGERTEKLQAMMAELDKMEADLEQEKYGEAVDIHRNVSMSLKDMVNLPAQDRSKIDQRLRAAAPMVMEFKDWRRWGTDQAREHLIETAQGLENDDSMEPEQRAKQIKALRQEWRKLAQMEPGKQRQQWKNFDSKVTAAYEPSKQHFAEQAKQRAEHLQQREAICLQLETMKTETDWTQVDWKSQYSAINEVRKSWKSCGTVGHKEWKAINQRFNDAMDGLEAHLSGEREQNFKARQQLVAQAEALLDKEDVKAAISDAKRLQANWEITIPSRPREEQKLWKAFRNPIDEVFKRLSNERQSERSETSVRIQQKDDLCKKLEDILALPADDFMTPARELSSLRDAFSAIRDIPKAVHHKLEDRFNTAEQAVLKRIEQVSWQKHLSTLDELAQASAALKAGEAETNVLAANQTAGETLCLQLEILLDAETPAESRQQRMEYQVAQLSEAMRSPTAEQGNTEQQALGLLKAWYQLGAMPAEVGITQQARIEALRQLMAK